MKRTLLTSMLSLAAVWAMAQTASVTPATDFRDQNSRKIGVEQLFDTDGNAYFDQLYIGNDVYNYSFTALHNTAVDRYIYNTDGSASYAVDKYANGEDAYLGRTPRYEAESAEWQALTDAQKRNYDDLTIYRPTSDGMIRTWGDEIGTYYYGWHQIQRDITRTYYQVRKATLSMGSISGSIDITKDPSFTYSISGTYYGSNKNTVNTGSEGIALTYLSTTADATAPVWAAEDIPANVMGAAAAIPTASDFATYIDTQLESKILKSDNVKNAIYNGKDFQKSIPSEVNFVLDADNGLSCKVIIVKTYKDGFLNAYKKADVVVFIYKTIKYRTDELYLWARKTNSGELDSEGYTQNDVLTKCVYDETDAAVCYLDSSRDGEQSEAGKRQLLTVAQKRHTFLLKSDNSAPTVDYVDVTTYLNSALEWAYSTSTSGNAGSYAHHYDTQAATSLKPQQISDNITITTLNASSGATGRNMWVYEKAADGRSYTYSKALPTNKTGEEANQYRAGTVQNKKVYITGNAFKLCVGTQDGWMQPINTDIYLDNAKLQCCANKSSNAITRSYSTSDFTAYDTCMIAKGSSAVFYLPGPTTAKAGAEDTVRIHLRGKNYLAGQAGGGQKLTLKVSVATASADASPTVAKHCAPIEIKDIREFMTFDKDGPGAKATSKKIPYIACSFDDRWANDSIMQEAYLDLSCAPNTGQHYVCPLYTGGSHGTYLINGGQLNLWPANAYVADKEKDKEVEGANIHMSAGHFSNYLACGTSQFDLPLKASQFTVTGSGLKGKIVATAIKAAVASLDLKILVNGVGGGLPAGKLIVNGGTITAQTDLQSFANKGIANVGLNYTLLGPNIIFNGGSFRNKEFLQATACTNEEGIAKAVPTAKRKAPVNKFNQTLTRIEYAYPDANTNYSDWTEAGLNQLRDVRAYLINDGDATKQYFYGMEGVVSDANKKGYFYVPQSAAKNFYRNYVVRDGQTLSSMPQPAWNVVLHEGGEIRNASAFTPQRHVYYKRYFDGINYSGMCMPFRVESIEGEEDGKIDGWVSLQDNPSADNTDAWFWMYHLDDGSGNCIATGLGDEFRQNYHTHQTGDYMLADMPYVLRFEGEEWATDEITFRSELSPTVPAAGNYAMPTAPTADNTFLMAGNNTMRSQTLTGSVYLLRPDEFGDDDFHQVANPTLRPFEVYLLANQRMLRLYRTIGKNIVMNEETDVATDLAVFSTAKTLQVCAAQQHLYITSLAEQSVSVYSVSGALITTQQMQPQQTLIVPAETGVYVVRGNDEYKKVIVN